MQDIITIKQHYEVWCHDKEGRLKWHDEFDNLIPYEGRNQYLDATIKTGLSSPAWYVGLVGTKTTGYAVGDTMSSHGGWTEDENYDEANRQAYTPGTISNGSVDNSASKAVFTISATTTINGCFMCSNNTKGGTTGTLLGEGDFSIAQSLNDDDVLTVQITITIT